MKKYLVIGNGVAGATAAENIRKRDAGGNITIVSDEDIAFYYRVGLNEYVCGEKTEQNLIVKGKDWYKDQDIDLMLKTRIVGANPLEKIIVTERRQLHGILKQTRPRRESRPGHPLQTRVIQF